MAHNKLVMSKFSLQKTSAICTAFRYPKLNWFVPSGAKSWFESSGIPAVQVNEMVWWQEFDLAKGDLRTKIVFTPTNHWSRRGAFDENKCLWGSWTVVGAEVCS